MKKPKTCANGRFWGTEGDWDPPQKGSIHNGIYTIRHRTGSFHRTFKVSSPSSRSRFYGKRIVSILIGPDNTSDYQGFGFFSESEGIQYWRRFEDSQWVQTAEMFSKWMRHGPTEEMTSDWEIDSATFCIVCNRVLTTPASIKTGIGPVCAGRENPYVDERRRRLCELLLKAEALEMEIDNGRHQRTS